MNADLLLQIVQFILKRDLRFCPTFSKLKSLLLSGWCVVGEQRALACILQHSPILEKLTIDVYGDNLADELPAVFLPCYSLWLKVLSTCFSFIKIIVFLYR